MLQSAADARLAAGRGVVLEQVVAEAGAGPQQQQFDGEWWGFERAENALE